MPEEAWPSVLRGADRDESRSHEGVLMSLGRLRRATPYCFNKVLARLRRGVNAVRGLSNNGQKQHQQCLERRANDHISFCSGHIRWR